MAETDTIIAELTHPGLVIREELKSRKDINQKELAKELGVKPSFLNEIIKGKRPLTADYAIILEEIFDVPAGYWMKFQTQFEIAKAKTKAKNIEKIERIKQWKVIKENVPVAYFKKHKYLTDLLDKDIETILSIYQVSTLEELIQCVQEYKRSLDTQESESVNYKNSLAWSALVSYEVSLQQVNPFRLANMEQLYTQLNKVFYANADTVSETKRILNMYGIKFVILPQLDSTIGRTPLEDSPFWSADHPTIAIAQKHSGIDEFAYSVMYKLGHIERHWASSTDGGSHAISKEQQQLAQSEMNAKALECLISFDLWSNIRKEQKLNDERIIELGHHFKIHPAILYARLSLEREQFEEQTSIDKLLR